MLSLLAVISGQSLLQAVIWIVVAGVIWWLISWLIGYVGLPAPFAKVARVILAVVAVILLINLLLGLVGHPLIAF